jgi:N-acyl-L-homoserine lactone synthetase
MAGAEFEVVVADTTELREAAFALRHDVYCRELGYEPVRADGLERDSYDDRAHHYLLAHVPTGTWAACVRIVFPGESPDSLDLPFELAVPAPPKLTAMPRTGVGEISRFTVAADHRHGPALVAAAFAGLVATDRAGLDSAVCLMSLGLQKRMRPLGIRFTQLTAVVDHHGRRALFDMCPQRTLSEIRPEYQGVLSSVRSRIEEQLRTRR